MVYAVDEVVRRFYEHFEFEPVAGGAAPVPAPAQGSHERESTRLWSKRSALADDSVVLRDIIALSSQGHRRFHARLRRLAAASFIRHLDLPRHAGRAGLPAGPRVPVLRDRLHERFHHLEPIDLRWGVETASADEQHAKEMPILKVCLAEIKRSRPFLIALVGDRYGWLPPVERMRAAAEEAGFGKAVAGKSVTALEIEYGILDSEEQRQMSRVYFREPLPYGEMDPATAAEYCDLKAGPDGAEAYLRLEALKERIRTEMPGRWRTYRAQWDAESRRVTNLEVWGAQVLEDVRTDLEEATREFAGAAPATWQREEAWVTEQFIEEKSRDFKGRLSSIEEAVKAASSSPGDASGWGLCLTGEAGSGKSSLFAKLARELAAKDVVLLTHAAGVTPRSSQVDVLLRRWTGELAAQLGEADPSESLSPREEMERAFSSVLSRVAGTRRVVCLIDALNQFERTPAGRHLTWLPKLWPENARLIATGIPGSESATLLGRGCREWPLPAG